MTNVVSHISPTKYSWGIGTNYYILWEKFYQELLQFCGRHFYYIVGDGYYICGKLLLLWELLHLWELLNLWELLHLYLWALQGGGGGGVRSRLAIKYSRSIHVYLARLSIDNPVNSERATSRQRPNQNESRNSKFSRPRFILLCRCTF